MQIVAALFLDAFDIVPPSASGGPTRLNLTGVHFSAHVPAEPPVTVAPHLVVLVRCPPDEAGIGALEVVFRRDGEQVARNVQPLQVDPGRFSYRLVRAELALDGYEPIEAHCRVDDGPATVVPYTPLPPAPPTDGGSGA